MLEYLTACMAELAKTSDTHKNDTNKICIKIIFRSELI